MGEMKDVVEDGLRAFERESDAMLSEIDKQVERYEKEADEYLKSFD